MSNKQEKRELKFEKIDDWNRPVFKDKYGNRFGSVDKLFGWDVSKEEVLRKVTEKDITYFGTKFNCEPEGIKINSGKIKLVLNFT